MKHFLRPKTLLFRMVSVHPSRKELILKGSPQGGHTGSRHGDLRSNMFFSWFSPNPLGGMIQFDEHMFLC